MEIRTYDTGENWTVEFTQDHQTFTLDYYGTEEECTWMARQLAEAFERFAGRYKSIQETEITFNG
jgi:hypothetical protein